MIRQLVPALAATLALVLAAGCPGSSTEQVTCDLDVKKLDGQWVSLKGGGSGSDVPDKYSRVEFKKNDEGKDIAVYTAGQLAPGNPATNKYTYEFVKFTNLDEALFVANTMKDKSKQRIERLKKDNRRLDLKFEGRLYVSVNKKNCSLTIKDMYATWVKGEEIEDSNPSGVRTFIKNDYSEDPSREFSMVHCDDVAALYFFDKKEIDLENDKALDPKEGIYSEEPVYIHFIPAIPEEQGDDKDAIAEAYKKKGLTATEGCTYDYELWMRDHKVDGAQKIAIEPKEDGSIHWVAEHSFEKSSADGIYIEMHRYATCGGKRKLLTNGCTVAWPNRSRAEYEEEAKKAKEGEGETQEEGGE